MNTRQADVFEPLMSVADMVDQGHMVVFDSDGSFAVKKDSGRKTRFDRSGKKWQLHVQLEAPEKANQKVSQIMAEMRETHRQDNKTLAEKVVDEILQHPKDRNEMTDFWWAAPPTRCA